MFQLNIKNILKRNRRKNYLFSIKPQETQVKEYFMRIAYKYRNLSLRIYGDLWRSCKK